jgi:peptide deformylase
LRKKGERVDEITDDIRKLAADMIETFDDKNGIGLAAQQVGRPLALFVMRHYIHHEDGKWDVTEPFVYINPKILEYSGEKWVEEEGCLSIPKLRMPVERPFRIKIEATDLEGKRFTQELEWHNARAVMHENDHINGVLYIDRVEDKFRKPFEAALREIKKKRSWHDPQHDRFWLSEKRSSPGRASFCESQDP